ncbi:response regulator [Anaerovibrio sp.]|uniref:response regulator n=1 Tax=Anaerovibrio sp. TaxID=1872532 RepID=UPI0025BF310A|nr:response regulator [Anaerovibrio sp.]MBR2142860.1 response regulator [Anaerovibrio sp.]
MDAVTTEKKKILVIDDAEVNQMLLTRMLADYEVLTASDDKEGMALLQKNADSLSLIILDLVLPEVNGIELLQQIKSDPATKNIPVIIMSAQVQMEQTTLDMGAVEFWRKPFYNAAEVQKRVAKIIR